MQVTGAHQFTDGNNFASFGASVLDGNFILDAFSKQNPKAPSQGPQGIQGRAAHAMAVDLNRRNELWEPYRRNELWEPQ
ncbi:hypothetical protein Pint_29392 [Pistacia integerrima]|uniref:Uncharacterized protein n=1 Tax=Pistacia integerrima TaxID=434235 RepID=A0ACC0WZS4_9ROSI|nr:hypothetical protein Pint_29392 [Pistacia integerrima]